MLQNPWSTLCDLLPLEKYFLKISQRIPSLLTDPRNFSLKPKCGRRISKIPWTLSFNYITKDGYSFLWRTALFNGLTRSIKPFLWTFQTFVGKNTNPNSLDSSYMFHSSLHHLVLFRCTIARYIKGGLYQSGSGESVLDVLVQNPRRSIWRAGHIWWKPDTRKNHPPDGVCRPRENNSLQSADHGRQKPG